MSAVSIAPFPADINREHFASWLSGFVDGEGCFVLGWSNPRRKNGRPAAALAIALRDDDRAILELIRSFWGFGYFVSRKSNRRNPSCAYVAKPVAGLMSVIIPHFERHPLLAKKSRDFSIWKEGVQLIAAVSARRVALSRRPTTRAGRKAGRRDRLKWQPAELERFAAIKDALSWQRSYAPPVISALRSSKPSSLFDS